MILKLIIAIVILGPLLAMFIQEMKRNDRLVKEEEMMMDMEEQ